MNEESTQEESVKVHWTFDEAAAIAEHLHRDLGVDRCLFMMGGWTRGATIAVIPTTCRPTPSAEATTGFGGGDRPHPGPGLRGLPARQLPGHVSRRQELEPGLIEKNAGRLADPGRALAGRPRLHGVRPEASRAGHASRRTCRRSSGCSGPGATLSTRPTPWDHAMRRPATSAGPQRDIAWKIHLEPASRQLFGLFGSECGREWALPHSDFFEGLVGVSGRITTTSSRKRWGPTVIPFWEMVYHDCQVCYGKYGYCGGQAGRVRRPSCPVRTAAALPFGARSSVLEAAFPRSRPQHPRRPREPSARGRIKAGPSNCTRTMCF